MRRLLYISVLFLLTLSCKNQNENSSRQHYDLDIANAKEITLFADFQSEYLLNQLGVIYTRHFPKASISPQYRNDQGVFDAIVKDSTRLIVLMRECSENELQQLKNIYKANALQYTFAYDAIGLVTDRESSKQIISSDDFDHYIANSSDYFVVVKDHLDLFQHMLEIKGVQIGKRSVKVVQSIDDLNRFLKANSGYIGILPFSLVSNKHTDTYRQYSKDFNWLGIENDSAVIYPSQSSIYLKEWPLIIPYNILYCKLSTEDGVGFVKFLHTRQASKLILKSGLVPVVLPEREIKVESQSFEL